MPSIAPLVSVLNETTTETYNPSSLSTGNAEFVDSSPAMVYDNRLIRVVSRAAAAGNTGRVTEHLGVRPIPLAENCCVDVTKPEGNTFKISTMIRKTSSKAQALALVEMIRAYVLLDDFEEVVTESAFY